MTAVKKMPFRFQTAWLHVGEATMKILSTSGQHRIRHACRNCLSPGYFPPTPTLLTKLSKTKLRT